MDFIYKDGIPTENLTDFYGCDLIPPSPNMFTLDDSFNDKDLPKLNIDLKPLNLIDDTQDKRRDLDGPGIHGESVCDGSA